MKEKHTVILKEGKRDLDEFSWIRWAWFKGNVSNEVLADCFGYYPFYGGPGKLCGKIPQIKRTAYHTLVTQELGWNV